MRSFGTATALITLLLLAGCGSSDGDADDVPTITTRPSTSAPTDTTTEPTDEPTTSMTASATETSASPTETQTPTESAGPSPEPPTDQPVGPASYRQALSRLASRSSGEQVDIARFSTPDDVIYCLLDDPVIGPACELRRGFIRDDEVCGGAAEGVGRIETFQGRARPACNTDTIREPGAEVIAGDGVIAVSGDIRCLVETAGVTCVDATPRTGFFLAPGEYHVF
jgi:hypothetical protein